jgi:ankyrin repeat and BTB/POZ domain-containing protein 1
MVLRKGELEAKLRDDIELVKSGVLREDNPLDLSPEFNDLLEACRQGNLKRVQELISAGVNLNGRDRFDYTPLIIVRGTSLPETATSCTVAREADLRF